MSGHVLETRFDVSAENGSAYRAYTRGNRLILSVALWGLVAVQAIVALSLTGIGPWHIGHGPSQQLAVGGLYAMLLPLSGMLAYSVFWLSKPGAKFLIVSDTAVILGFDDGTRVQVRWSSPRFHLRISRVGGPGSSTAPPGERGFSEATIQTFPYPVFRLSQASLTAIIAQARAQNLEVREFYGSIGEKAWDTILIKRTRTP